MDRGPLGDAGHGAVPGPGRAHRGADPRDQRARALPRSRGAGRLRDIAGSLRPVSQSIGWLSIGGASMSQKATIDASAVAEECLALADLLEASPASAWDAPSLCEG